MQARREERFAGVALILAAVLGALVMSHHPTGHDLSPDHDHAAHAAMLNRWVHGVGVLMAGVVLVGLLLMRRTLADGPWSLVALVAQGIGLGSVVLAALASGFVATPVFEAMDGASAAEVEALRRLTWSTHLWNQPFAALYGAAFSIGMIAWVPDLRRAGVGLAWGGWVGAAIGLATTVALFGGQVTLGIHGFGAVLAGHGLWMIWMGVALLRRRIP